VTGPTGPTRSLATALGDDSSAIRRGDSSTNRPRRPTRRPATAVVVGAVALSVLAAGSPLDRINTGGWPQVRRFFAAALAPELSGDFLALVWRESLVTLSFAVLGTALALVLGLVGGVVLSRRWWWRPGRDRPGWPWQLVRAAAVVPRGVHEVVWALLLLNVLGLDPMVAVLAIGIPFGAITAKVFADAIDDADVSAHRALRLAGAARLPAMAYAIGPAVRSDLVSYGFYRFECAIRSAAILGVVGAGGLGFQLSLSFTSLRYGEVWTVLYALVLLNGAADAWSGWVRRRSPSVLAADGARLSRSRQRSTAFATGVVLAPAVVLSWWWVGADVASLWSRRTREQVAYLAGELVPPTLRDGWWTIVEQSLDTVALSVLAMAAAFALALPIALVTAGAIGPGGPTGLAIRVLCRALLLLTRAVPPPVWAIVALFVLRAGPWPGAAALAVYNLGVLGRLLSEAIEGADPAPARALRAGGATPLQAAAYATVPATAARLASLGLYRWEVAIRETVVVGVVGAGGLGRALDQELSAFAWSNVAGIVLALVVVTFLVDAVSTALRRRAG
jgi:phosphonate transport system permease protein